MMNQLKIVKGSQQIKVSKNVQNGKIESGEYKTAILEIIFSNFTIYVFQGGLSQFDILIKYREKESRIRTPKHIHWVVDILLKQSKERELANDFLILLQKCWKECLPLTNNDFDSIKSFITNQWSLLDYNKFEKLNDYGEYPIDFLFVLMNLLSVQEKTNRSDAYMFGKIIDELLEDELDIFKIVATAGFGGR